MTQTFVESCVDFEAAHLSVFMPYPEIPTLNGHKELCSVLHTACMQRNAVVLGLNLNAQVMAIKGLHGAV